MNRYQAAFIPAGFLVLALAGLPYGYYTFLRMAVTVWAAYLAWVRYDEIDGVGPWSVAFGLIAILFNPVFPVYLAREAWAVIDLAAAAVFAGFGGYFLLNRNDG